jgi:hypothetical protein
MMMCRRQVPASLKLNDCTDDDRWSRLRDEEVVVMFVAMDHRDTNANHSAKISIRFLAGL